MTETDVRAELTVHDEGGTVTVRKLVTRGERLEIDAGERLTLDALLLEGLSWQRERERLAAVVPDPEGIESDPVPAAGGEPVPDTAFTVSNEYSHTVVRKVDTEGGEAVEISTEGRGTDITLGAPSLRALAAVGDTYVFSQWFETPFGPEDTALEGPL